MAGADDNGAIDPDEVTRFEPVRNCQVAGLVDFGNGPVQVRCTQSGVHLDHACVIFLTAE